LAEVVRKREVDLLYTSVISSLNGGHLLSYLKNLSAKFSEKTIFVSGQQLMLIHDTLPSNIRLLYAPEQFILHLDLLSREEL